MFKFYISFSLFFQKSLLSKFLLNVTATNRNSGDLSVNIVWCSPEPKSWRRPWYGLYVVVYILIVYLVRDRNGWGNICKLSCTSYIRVLESGLSGGWWIYQPGLKYFKPLKMLTNRTLNDFNHARPKNKNFYKIKFQL